MELEICQIAEIDSKRCFGECGLFCGGHSSDSE
jgi:hypothetical protein